MHTPPDDKAKILFLNQGRVTIYSFGLFSTAILITGNIFFIIQHPSMWAYGIFIALTAFYLGLSYLVGFAGKAFDKNNHIMLREHFKHSEWKMNPATIDIYLPICKEPHEIIINTWVYIKRLKEEYGPNAKVYVLDDGKSDEAKAAAEMYKFEYIRRDTNELKKAGNLRHAFTRTDGEFIAIFDADFCPRIDFFDETLPYFFDPFVAIVQTPQFFSVKKNYTWVQNGAGAIQELFYRLIQVNRDTFGGAICVGTNAIYRRSALRPFGGTAPMAYSEDVHTGFQLISTGWKIKYIPIILCEGLCPETTKQFFTQQYRWALGSISLFFSKKFWRAKITKMQRISYLTGMLYYMTTGISIFLTPIPGLYMLAFHPDQIFWYNLLFSIPSLIYSTIFMYAWMRLPMSIDVMRVRFISYFCHFLALTDFLKGTLEEWKPTGAASTSKRYIIFTWLMKTQISITFFGSLLLVLFRVGEGYPLHNYALVLFFIILQGIITIPLLEE